MNLKYDALPMFSSNEPFELGKQILPLTVKWCGVEIAVDDTLPDDTVELVWPSGRIDRMMLKL
jgi:hypothetical protein